MILRRFFIFTTVSTLVRTTDRNGECLTPNLEKALCIPAKNCDVIVDAIKTRNTTAIDFAKKSQCGHDTEPLVCCGSTGYPQPETYDIFDIFSKPPVITERAPFPSEPPVRLENFDTDKLPDRTLCGLQKEADRIVGGELTEIGEFPWMAALEFKNKITNETVGVRCGGSILNERYILTAAHCLKSIEFEVIAVLLGEWKLSTDPDCKNKAINDCADPIERIEVEELISHPFYSKRDGNNDIALILLQNSIQFTDYIRPICLPPNNLPPVKIHDFLTVSGWGATTYSGEVNDVKLKTQVPLIATDVCKKKIPNKRISQNHVCAGGEKGRDACQGDSGGPLMRIYKEEATAPDQWFLEGVVSSGVGCGGSGYPALYVRVAKYIRWIIAAIRY